MPGKFEIKTASNGKFFFNLKAANGEVILTSQQYICPACAVWDTTLIPSTPKCANACWTPIGTPWNWMRSSAVSPTRSM